MTGDDRFIVARDHDGRLRMERVRPYVPSEEAISKAFASITKAYPYLVEHASHLDGEFDNALTNLRRYVTALQKFAPKAPA